MESSRTVTLPTGLSTRAGVRKTRSPWPPAVVWIPVALVAGAMVLPPAYLVLSTLDAGTKVVEILFRSHTLNILARTVLLVAAVTGATIAISVPMAWLTVRTDLSLGRVWSVITVLPLVIPSYVGGFVIVVALGPWGMLQGWLAPLGVERLPEIYGFPGAVLTLTLFSYPYVLLPVRAALWRLDPALEENSRSLGRGPWATFFRVILPQLRPAMAAGALLVALYTLSDFGAVSLLRYETFSWAIYLQYEAAFDRTMAAALSLVLVALALGILILEARSRGLSRYYTNAAGAVRPVSSVQLGRWRWPAFAFCGIVVTCALVMPISVLGYQVARVVSAEELFLLLWSATLNSMYVSGLAAIASVAAALPVAILAVRHGGRISALLERLTYASFALPGIVVALALVYFGVHYATPIYQTLGVLIFAYVVLFLPLAVGAIRASLLQVSPMVEEAARSLGRTPLQVFTTITFPLLRPGILAGAALVFLLTMKELPATLILGPIGFTTLATSIWSAAEEGFFAQAAAGGLLLILASSVPMAFLILREGRRAQ